MSCVEEGRTIRVTTSVKECQPPRSWWKAVGGEGGIKVRRGQVEVWEERKEGCIPSNRKISQKHEKFLPVISFLHLQPLTLIFINLFSCIYQLCPPPTIEYLNTYTTPTPLSESKKKSLDFDPHPRCPSTRLTSFHPTTTEGEKGGCSNLVIHNHGESILVLAWDELWRLGGEKNKGWSRWLFIRQYNANIRSAHAEDYISHVQARKPFPGNKTPSSYRGS